MYVYVCTIMYLYAYMAVSMLFLIQVGGVGRDRGTFIVAYMMQTYPGAPLNKKYL